MIQGNQAWTQALAQPQKQPLYSVELPDFMVAITSFTPAQQPSASAVNTTGYGVEIYGVAGYGT
jgi:hypothetical protein